MKKFYIEIIEDMIKWIDRNLWNESYTPLWEETYNAKIEILNQLKEWIENMNECWVYTNLITCDFKENTMTFDIPKWLQLKSGEYYIEFNK